MNNLTSKPGMTDTIQAAVALPPHRLVDVNGALCPAGVKAWGATEIAFDDAEQAGIIIQGIVILECGAAIPKGSKITSDATGRAVVAAGANEVNGWAKSATTAAGEFVSIKLV
jgi:hypothetical protein